MTEQVEEIEVVSPGQLLREGREKQGWSQQEVARRLNLRAAIVQALEEDRFDQQIGATFIRGYLKAYAKLLGISEDLVVAAFEHMGGDKHVEPSAMQSFSKRTAREAHDSRLMWLTWGIALLLIGLSVAWWVQDRAQSFEPVTEVYEPLVEQTAEPVSESPSDTPEAALPDAISAPVESTGSLLQPVEPILEESVAPEAQPTDKPAIVPSSSELVMTFSGDCWVRVEDATGERLAVGTKREGRVMVLNGRPPYQIILGAPELVSIEYGGEPFDIPNVRAGQTARFTIPTQE